MQVSRCWWRRDPRTALDHRTRVRATSGWEGVDMEGDPWDLAGWRRWLLAAGRSMETVRVQSCHVSGFARRHQNPQTVTLDDLVEWLAEPRAAETRKSRRSAVRAYYRWATLTGRVEVDPTVHLPAVSTPPGLPRPIADEAIIRSLTVADDRTRLMILLGALAGLRRAEIAATHRRDVQDGWLRVVGKGGRTRMVPLHPTLQTALTRWPEAGWLFPSPLGGHLTADRVGRILRDALGVGTAHQLRHRCLTAAYRATRDLRAVQQLAGHTKPETTARYTAMADEQVMAAVMGATLTPTVRTLQGVRAG